MDTSSRFSSGDLLQPPDCDRIEADAEEALAETVKFVLRTAAYERTDRLWPAESLVYDTNPLSVAYGACGPALFLSSPDTPTALPRRAMQWILDRPLSTDEYPPGLFLGLAGIACTMLRLGAVEHAVGAMDLALQSPLLFEEPGLLLGVAGWGLAALDLFDATRDAIWLNWAVRGGDHLLRCAQPDHGKSYWIRSTDGQTHFGFGHGASGIALFLLRLQQASGRQVYGEAAARAMEFDLSNGTDSEYGCAWRRFQGDNLVMPYLLHGSAGVGSVALRFYEATGESRYLKEAERIAHGQFIKFTVTPGLLEGLAGIGEFLLDSYRVTGHVEYRNRALDLTDSLLWFRIRTDDGSAWPGRWLNNMSNDYAAGAAGIGLFLARLLRPGPGPRPFLDPLSA
ncbi:lanthionine synthetase C family protein [Streptomyces sp. NPDC001743]|uniref:lanthionine synthetase C family protein n=1 Tax=Streptomyces sp. NPDC001743 TaxID=3154397 RepID=UPI0033199A4E